MTIIVKSRKEFNETIHNDIVEALERVHSGIKEQYPDKYMDYIESHLDMIMLKIASFLRCELIVEGDKYTFKELGI